jgi:hypothetical protein
MSDIKYAHIRVQLTGTNASDFMEEEPTTTSCRLPCAGLPSRSSRRGLPALVMRRPRHALGHPGWRPRSDQPSRILQGHHEHDVQHDGHH